MSVQIAVIGNCQSLPLSRSLEALCLGSSVTAIPNWDFANLFGSDPDRILDTLKQADVIVCQDFGPGPFGTLTSAVIRDQIKNCMTVPNVCFGGFHPDLTYLTSDAGMPAPVSPMGDYHSSLIVHGYLSGFDVTETRSLFRKDIFSVVGYHSSWNAHQSELLQTGRMASFNLDEFFQGWMRRGCFMHTSNHPKLFVFSDIAREIMRLSDIKSLPISCEDYLNDPLIGTVWPVYPEIAEHLGISGNYVFKRNLVSDTLGFDIDPIFDLDDFIELSFSMYDRQVSNGLHSAHVNLWHGDAALCRMIVPSKTDGFTCDRAGRVS